MGCGERVKAPGSWPEQHDGMDRHDDAADPSIWAVKEARVCVCVCFCVCGWLFLERSCGESKSFTHFLLLLNFVDLETIDVRIEISFQIIDLRLGQYVIRFDPEDRGRTDVTCDT